MTSGKGSEGGGPDKRAAGDPGAWAQDAFGVQRLRELVELMESHELSEIDLQHEQSRIRLRRGRPVRERGGVAPLPQAAPVPQPAAPAAPAPASANPNIVTINSPMVGTFYSRPNPDSEPFVKVGDHVGPETVVCIIEAMKVFNEIQAEVAGQIVAVLADNEEAVDFGKPLFKVDTSK